MTIGQKISSRRKQLGLTQDELAEQLDISPQAVSRWENGWNLPDIDKIKDLADILKTSIATLIGDDLVKYQWELRDQLYSEEHMFTRLKTIAELEHMPETYRALYYIREKHSGQYRKELKYSAAKVPYIVHPLMMACHAVSMGICDDETIAVILLHDVCEDCGVEPAELPFNENIRTAVGLLTKKKDPDLSKEESNIRYYKAIGENRIAAVTKVIDRCNNISTMAQSFNDKKLAAYITETETFVYPLLTQIKKNWYEYNSVVFLIKYQMLAVLESLKNILTDKS